MTSLDPHPIVSGLCFSVQALAVVNNFNKSIEASFGILCQFGEELPRDIEDEKLQIDIDRMTCILMSTSDDSIYNMTENKDTKMATLLKLYAYLARSLHYFQPRMFGSVSLRMVELTMQTGLNTMSPLAFALFGIMLVTSGYVTVGCRLGE